MTVYRKKFYVIFVVLVALLSPLSIYSTNVCDIFQDRIQCDNKNDSAGFSYWEIKNETNHRTIVVVSDKETVHIEPGETKKVFRTESFKFTVGYPGKYANRESVQTFTIDDHALGVYSRYFGKKSKLQFLIGIAKKN